MLIIVDSDGLIGTLNANDALYSQSIKLLEKLNRKEAVFIYPATTIAEATTVLKIRLNNPSVANQIMESVKSGDFQIDKIDQSTLVEGMSFLEQSRSKHSTLFDGIVAAVAKKYKADAIFSFDKFYKKQGFKLASEI